MNRDRVTWTGLLIVGVTAIVWSFTALSDLARLVGVTARIPLPWTAWELHVAWGLPVTVDVLALVATRVWLLNAAPQEAVRYARRTAWSAIAATIAGNAYHGLLVSSWRWDALVVSAVPAVAIGAIVHLAVLAARPAHQPPATPPTWVAQDEMADVLRAIGDRQAAVGGDEPAQADEQAESGGEDVWPPSRREVVDTTRDAAIIADLRALAGETGRRYVRDEVKTMYGIGSPRAQRILTTMGWLPRAVPDTREQAEPGGERAAVPA